MYKEISINKDFLENHEITRYNRAEIIDWMLQVFKVIKKLSTKTFFIVVKIMDFYFIAK